MVLDLDFARTLEAAVERLEHNYEVQRAQLQAEIDRNGNTGIVTPESMTDYQGRPILLEALTAIVQARTALAGRGAAGS